MGTAPNLQQIALAYTAALTILLFPGTARAQQAATVPGASEAAQDLKDLSKLTPLEIARIDYLAMRRQRDQALQSLDQCQGSLAPFQRQQRDTDLGAQISAMRQLIEIEHPGYVWDQEKGTLVPKPTPPATAKAPDAPLERPAPVKKKE